MKFDTQVYCYTDYRKDNKSVQLSTDYLSSVSKLYDEFDKYILEEIDTKDNFCNNFKPDIAFCVARYKNNTTAQIYPIKYYKLTEKFQPKNIKLGDLLNIIKNDTAEFLIKIFGDNIETEFETLTCLKQRIPYKYYDYIITDMHIASGVSSSSTYTVEISKLL